VILDAEREIFGTSRASLHLEEWLVTKETPKGCWVGYHQGHKFRWVSNTSKKRFAHPTKQEALNAYKQRKISFVKHSKARLNRALEDLSLVDDIGEV
jgi:hypothetical protein